MRLGKFVSEPGYTKHGAPSQSSRTAKRESEAESREFSTLAAAAPALCHLLWLRDYPSSSGELVICPASRKAP